MKEEENEDQFIILKGLNTPDGDQSLSPNPSNFNENKSDQKLHNHESTATVNDEQNTQIIIEETTVVNSKEIIYYKSNI